jgi:hypothetical protein
MAVEAFSRALKNSAPTPPAATIARGLIEEPPVGN